MKYIDANKIRAEIKKRLNWKREIQTSYYMGCCDELKELLSFLDTLEEPEQPTMGYDEAYLNEKIAKASKSWEGVDVDKFMDEVRGREPVSDDLEEEVKRYYSENFSYITSDNPTLFILTNIARHFAKWGAEHAGGSLGTMVSGWIARDRNGHLNFFLAEPRRFTNVRGEEYWIGHARMKMPNEFLPELSWSNEPIKVKLKVEKYESSKS